MNAHQFMKMTALVAMIAGLAACAKSSDDNRGVRLTGARGGNAVTQALMGQLKTTCSNGQSAVGQVYSSTSPDFRADVSGLLSATMDPSGVGQISGQMNNINGTGVDLYMKLPTGGTINSTNSYIRLLIYDSFVGQTYDDGTVIGPIEVAVPAQSGSFQGGQFTVTFQDIPDSAGSPVYGTITIQGYVQGAQASGQISYRNFKRFDNGTPASGTLGSFTIPTCGLQ